MSSWWQLLGDEGGHGMPRLDFQMSRPKGFLCFAATETDCFLKIQIFLCLFFSFSEYSLISSVFPSQIESSRAFSSWLCTPISALFVTTMRCHLPQEESLYPESRSFSWNFLRWAFCWAFSPLCLFLLPLVASAAFQGFGGPLCRFFGICRL